MKYLGTVTEAAVMVIDDATNPDNSFTVHGSSNRPDLGSIVAKEADGTEVSGTAVLKLEQLVFDPNRNGDTKHWVRVKDKADGSGDEQQIDANRNTVAILTTGIFRINCTVYDSDDIDVYLRDRDNP